MTNTIKQCSSKTCIKENITLTPPSPLKGEGATDDDSFILNTLENIASLIAGAALPFAAVKFFSRDGGGGRERLDDSTSRFDKYQLIVIEANRVLDDIRQEKPVQVDLDKLTKTLMNDAIRFKGLLDTSIVDADNFKLFAEYVNTIASMYGARARARDLQGDKSHALLAVQAQLETLQLIRSKAMELGGSERTELMTDYITSYLKGLAVARETVIECKLKYLVSETITNAAQEATSLADSLISTQITKLNERTDKKQVVTGTANLGSLASLEQEDFPGSDYYESAARVVDALSKAGPIPETLQTKIEELRGAMQRYIDMRNAAMPESEPLVLQGPVLALPPALEGLDDERTLPDYEKEAHSEFAKLGTKDVVPLYLHSMLEGWLNLLEFRVNAGIVTEAEARAQLDNIIKMSRTYKGWEKLTRKAEQVLTSIDQTSRPDKLLDDFERDAPIGPMPTELIIAEAEVALSRDEALEPVGYSLKGLIRELENEAIKLARPNPPASVEKQEIAIWRLLAKLNWKVGNTPKRHEAMLNYLHKVYKHYEPVLRIAEGVEDPASMTPEERRYLSEAMTQTGAAVEEFEDIVLKTNDRTPNEMHAAAKLWYLYKTMETFMGPVPFVEVDMRKIWPEDLNIRGREVQAKALMMVGDFREAADHFLQLLDIMGRSGHDLLVTGMTRRKAAEALDTAGDKTAAAIQSVLAELEIARFDYDRGEYGQAAETLIRVGKTVLSDPAHLDGFRDRTVFRFKDTVSMWFHSTVLRYKLSAISDIDLRVTLERIARRMDEFGWEAGRDKVLNSRILEEARERLRDAAQGNGPASGEGSPNLPALVARSDRPEVPSVEKVPPPKPEGRFGRTWDRVRDRFRRGRGK